MLFYFSYTSLSFFFILSNMKEIEKQNQMKIKFLSFHAYLIKLIFKHKKYLDPWSFLFTMEVSKIIWLKNKWFFFYPIYYIALMQNLIQHFPLVLYQHYHFPIGQGLQKPTLDHGLNFTRPENKNSLNSTSGKLKICHRLLLLKRQGGKKIPFSTPLPNISSQF